MGRSPATRDDIGRGEAPSGCMSCCAPKMGGRRARQLPGGCTEEERMSVSATEADGWCGEGEQESTAGPQAVPLDGVAVGAALAGAMVAVRARWSFSAVIGISVRRTPTASLMALPMAAAPG